MKTVYFDTNVYSHLAQDDTAFQSQYESIASAVEQSKIKITASLLNVQEILLSPPEKIKKMFGVARRLTCNQLFDEPNKILARDFDSFIRKGGQTNNIYADLRWHDILDKGMNGGYNELYKNVKTDSEYHKYKKVYEKNVKKICGAARAHRNPKDEFSLKNLLTQRRDRGIIKNLLKLYYSEENAEFLAENIDFDKCHRLRYIIKYDLQLMHGHLIGSVRPRYGDNADMQHVIYAYDNSMFVSKDKFFLENLAAIKNERTKCVSFEEFTNEIAFINKWQ